MPLSEVLKDNLNIRLDSEYFKKQFIEFFNEVPDLQPLGSLVKSGYRVVYENTKIVEEKEAVKNNYPFFLQATDLDTPFIKTNNLFHVHEGEWLRYKKGRVKRGEILIEVKGKIDKVAIVPPDFPKKTLVSGSLFKISVNEKISKHVLLSYLISHYGQSFKDRFKTNLLISYISKPDLYRIPVPSFSKSFQGKIDEIFEEIFRVQKEAKTLYKTAEEKFLGLTGLLEDEPVASNLNIKSFSSSFLKTGRLDAEYYQYKYEALIRKIKSQKFTSLGEVVEIKKSFEPGSKFYSDEGLPFLRVADYDQFNLLEPQKFLTQDFVQNNKTKIDDLKPSKGTILYSKDGSVGTAYRLRKDYNGITSGAILHLKVLKTNNVLPDYLTLVLNSKAVKSQAERDSGGSVIQHWRVKEIQEVLIPLVSDQDQLEISELVQLSFDNREKGQKLLDTAKKAIEKAIEKNEKEALNYLQEIIGGEKIAL